MRNLDELLAHADEIHFARIHADNQNTTYAIAFDFKRDERRVIVGSGADAVDAIKALDDEMAEHWT